MNESLNRDTTAHMNLKHLAYNFNLLKQKCSPQTKIMGVVKANAYGHGAVKVAQTLIKQEVDYLAVALFQEAMELRKNGIHLPILVFTPIEISSIKEAISNQLTLTVFTVEQAEVIREQAETLQQKATVHIKVDTGMSRIGVLSKEEALNVAKELDSPWISIEGIFTHFAEAENRSQPAFTKAQFSSFIQTVEFLEENGFSIPIYHCANTAAALLYPEYHLDMVRLGIGLYGYGPDEELDEELDLKPVMTVSTRIAHIKTLSRGKSISYGRTYQTKETKQIATVIMGYADGVPRSLSNRGYFTVKGKKAPIVGRVCMDQIMIDVSAIDSVNIGEEAILFGNPQQNKPSLMDIATLINGFHYELLCQISSRIPKIYTED